MESPVDLKALRRLRQEPTFSPTDCPNFLTFRDFEQYRWYARTLAPLLAASRGAPLFVGHRQQTLWGQSPGETWMVVRYPTHRDMLRMATNPYYLLIPNRFRARGTRRLELGFTQPRDPASALPSQKVVLGLHADANDPGAFFEAVRSLAESHGVQVVYESELRLELDFIRDPKGADPRPLTYPITVALGGDRAALHALGTSDELASLLDGQARACAQLYERGDRYELLRFGPRKADDTPEARSKRGYRGWVNRFSTTPAGIRLATRVAARLDPVLYKATGGRFTSTGIPTVPQFVLTTMGRKSGLPREVQLAYTPDGDDWIVVASNFGTATHPAWSYNLDAHPEATVECDGERMQVTATRLNDADKQAIWPRLERQVPQYRVYVTRTDRNLRVYRLRRTTRVTTGKDD